MREAAACALASVLVAGSCAAEDVTDGVSGFLIEENADSLAAKLRELLRQPEAIQRVGEGAQREIYVSWEDAVAAAYERYGAVIENYRAGRYPAHDGLSDDFFRSMGAAMSLRAKRREAQRQLLEEVRRSRDSLLSDFADQGRRLSEQWEAQGKRVAEHWDAQSRRMSEQWEARSRRLDEMLEKLYQYTDRFM